SARVRARVRGGTRRLPLLSRRRRRLGRGAGPGARGHGRLAQLRRRAHHAAHDRQRGQGEFLGEALGRGRAHDRRRARPRRRARAEVTMGVRVAWFDAAASVPHEVLGRAAKGPSYWALVDDRVLTAIDAGELRAPAPALVYLDRAGYEQAVAGLSPDE